MKKSRIARPIAAVESPAVRSLPLVDLLVDTKAELFELMVRSGLRVLDAMLEEDRTALWRASVCASARACRVPHGQGTQRRCGGRAQGGGLAAAGPRRRA